FSNLWQTSTGLRLCALVALAAITAVIAHARAPDLLPLQRTGGHITPVIPAGTPRIEAVFVLDTTGSMTGLIEGAKQKIWSIASQIAGAQTTPEIRMGLIGYRDRGDVYVTRHFALDEDIDALYGHLQRFSAGGGGDGPESVNQALHEAVTAMDWSDDAGVYKVIFLVGDAPPHMDYQNDVRYADSVKLANARGIVVNTIQCGGDPNTAHVWREIARLSQGEYAAIAQDGAMVAMTTPMDEELAKLNREMSATVVAYGDTEQRDELLGKLRQTFSALPSVVASRLAYFDKKGGALNSGRADLVDAVSAGEVDLAELPAASMPEEMREMSPDQQRGHIARKARHRQGVQRRISVLVKERDAYLEAETKKLEAEGKADAFDAKVFEAIKSQAAEKGIAY
ncbi:MAG: vWA domain-containing protein, partial [Myxococcota bacterium]